MSDLKILPARKDADIAAAARLFTAYANWLSDDYGISLEFQNFAEELATLPGKYAAPKGELYVVRSVAGEALGCIAFRPIDDTTCEIKRLYVAMDWRGQKLGARLVSECLNGARTAGYARAVLDTAEWMKDAQALYERNGFVDIAPYYDNPEAGIRYMGAFL